MKKKKKIPKIIECPICHGKKPCAFCLDKGWVGNNWMTVPLVDPNRRKKKSSKKTNRKLTWEKVQQMRYLHEFENAEIKDLAKKFKVSYSSAYAVCTYAYWLP